MTIDAGEELRSGLDGLQRPLSLAASEIDDSLARKVLRQRLEGVADLMWECPWDTRRFRPSAMCRSMEAGLMDMSRATPSSSRTV
jgi:hypothetical protein